MRNIRKADANLARHGFPFSDTILDHVVHNSCELKLKKRSDAKEQNIIDPSRLLNGIIESPRRCAPTDDWLHRIE